MSDVVEGKGPVESGYGVERLAIDVFLPQTSCS